MMKPSMCVGEQRRVGRRMAALVAAGMMVAALSGETLGAAAPSAQAGAPMTSGATTSSAPLVVAVQQPPPAARDEFVPVKDLPVQEQLPAAPLLIAAYGFVWVMILLYLVILWRRLGKVEQELAGVSRQVEERRRD